MRNTIKNAFLLVLIMLPGVRAMALLRVGHLLTENRSNPPCIDAEAPRFSWQLISDQSDILQQAYAIQFFSDGKIIWNTGKLTSAQSVQVTYTGPALLPGRKYTWRVKVWDNRGNVSIYSQAASFRLGLKPSDWKASWITPAYPENPTMPNCPVFEKTVAIHKTVASAVVYITSHGLYEMRLNGKRVGNAYFTPGWTDYNKRLQYQCYDVTGLLQQGANPIQVILGPGWYKGQVFATSNAWGTRLGLLFQLAVRYTDGSAQTLCSDSSWRTVAGPARYSELYNGETIDNRVVSDTGTPVSVVNCLFDNLVGTENEPVRKQERFSPIKISTTPNGDTVADFGQNLAGWVRLKVRGRAGDSVKMEFGEVLDQSGNLYRGNLRSAKATDVFVLKGGTEETVEPHFTYHGFRYVRIRGLRVMPHFEQLEAIALYSDMPRTGIFTCSNRLINQLQHNIQWGENSNFVDIPTDCPQRDERLGWTGDAQLFCATAAFNHNVNNFFGKWLRDMAADQFKNGIVPNVIPFFGAFGLPAGGWGDAATIVPWTMYQFYGDKALLAAQYPSMKAWVDYMCSTSTNGLWNGNSFGDWLAKDAGMGNAEITDKKYIAQAYFYYSAGLLFKAAKLLSKDSDAATYAALLPVIQKAFLEQYIKADGSFTTNTQTARILALQFNLLPDALRKPAAIWLAEDIKSRNYHLATGFIGSAYINQVLTRFGYADVAYKLLLQETAPSWLYPVENGATTIWEHWDSLKPDGSFEGAAMNSFNNYTLGAVGDWLYKDVAGINTDTTATGYQKIIIKPHPGGNLTWVKAGLDTYYGKIAVYWRVENRQFILDVEIPCNTTAEVDVPQHDGFIKHIIGSGKYHYSTNI